LRGEAAGGILVAKGEARSEGEAGKEKHFIGRELQPTDRKRAFPQQDSHTVLLAFSGNHPIEQLALSVMNVTSVGKTI
jgi:hypothetical protein